MQETKTITFLENLTDDAACSQVRSALDSLPNRDEFASFTNLSVTYHGDRMCFGIMATPSKDASLKQIVALAYDGEQFVNLYQPPRQDARLEDPKLFVAGGRVSAVFNTPRFKGKNNLVCGEIYPKVGPFRRLSVPGRMAIEKNWGIYEHEGKVKALYTASPPAVLDLASTKKSVIRFSRDAQSERKIDLSYAVGTHPVRYGSHHYFMLHQKNSPGRARTYYLAKLAKIDGSTGELSVAHDVAYAHNVQSLMGYNKPNNNRVMSCTYVSGLHINDERVQLSYGINDADWNVANLPLSVLEDSKFSPMPESPSYVFPPEPPKDKPGRGVELRIKTKNAKAEENKDAKPAGPGDYLHKLFVDKYKLAPCRRCMEVIEQMNTLGVEGCVEQKAEIVADIWERRDQLKGWKVVAAKIAGKWEIGRLFDKAVEQARQELEKHAQTTTDPEA